MQLYVWARIASKGRRDSDEWRRSRTGAGAGSRRPPARSEARPQAGSDPDQSPGRAVQTAEILAGETDLARWPFWRSWNPKSTRGATQAIGARRQGGAVAIVGHGRSSLLCGRPLRVRRQMIDLENGTIVRVDARR